MNDLRNVINDYKIDNINDIQNYIELCFCIIKFESYCENLGAKVLQDLVLSYLEDAKISATIYISKSYSEILTENMLLQVATFTINWIPKSTKIIGFYINKWGKYRGYNFGSVITKDYDLVMDFMKKYNVDCLYLSI